jgi:serine/threonine protein kinase
MSLAGGTRLGPNEIVSHLGAGGMGEVYRAKDTRLGRDVAVKVLPGDFLEGEEPRARFEREAKALAALNHPNVEHLHQAERLDPRSVLAQDRLAETTMDPLRKNPRFQKLVAGK